MPDKELIDEKIRASGLKKEFIAQKLGMSLTSLNNKISGRTPFLLGEAFKLRDVLNLEEAEFNEIFLNRC